MRGQQRNQSSYVQSDSEEDNYNSDSDEEQNQNTKRKSTPPRRGRGRPPKNKKQRIADDSDDESSTQNSITNNSILPRRKAQSRDASRTRNMQSSNDVSANNTDTSTTDIPLPKRRGRPRKKSSETNASSNGGSNEDRNPGLSNANNSLRNVQNGVNDDSEEESCGSVVADSDISNETDSNRKITPSGKRGRGRPPRNKTPSLLDDSDNSDNNEESANNTNSRTEIPITNKRRGRPPKNPRPLALDDSDKEDGIAVEIDDDVDISTNNVFSRRSLRASTLNRGNTQHQINGHLSPQPGPSSARDIQHLSISERNGNVDESYEEESSSSSESIDSDDPLNDIRDSDRRKTEKRKCIQKKPSPRKKQKILHATVNGNSQSVSENSQRKQNGPNKKNQKDTLFDPKLVENLAQKLAYFLLVEDQKKCAIKKKAIITHVFKEEVYSTKLYNTVITKANSILKKVYGMELMEVENQKDSYLIVNILSRDLGINDYIDLPLLKQQQYGLILYLLTVIFMNENRITEDELEKALKNLKIDLTSKVPHPIFGDVRKYVTTELVKQMYLNYECVCKDPRRYEITWGVRAKEEVDKRDLLNFACEVWGDTVPENWIMQYRDAEKSASPV